jgi:hypothetical protein
MSMFGRPTEARDKMLKETSGKDFSSTRIAERMRQRQWDQAHERSV